MYTLNWVWVWQKSEEQHEKRIKKAVQVRNNLKYETER